MAGTGDTVGYYNYANTTDTTVYNWQPNYSISYIPADLQDEVEPISGEPKGAKYLISYAFKKAKDPVVFLKDKKDMDKYVEDLLANDRVDHKTIMIHEISKQYKPTKKTVKKEVVELEEIK